MGQASKISLQPWLPTVLFHLGAHLCLRQPHFLHLRAPQLCPQVLNFQTLVSRMIAWEGRPYFLLSLEGQKQNSLSSDSRKPDVFLLPLCMGRRLSSHTHARTPALPHRYTLTSTHPSVCTDRHTFLHPLTSISIHPFTCSSIHPPTHTYIYLPTNTPIYPSTSFPPSCVSISMPLTLSIHVDAHTHSSFHSLFLSSVTHLSIPHAILDHRTTTARKNTDWSSSRLP